MNNCINGRCGTPYKNYYPNSTLYQPNNNYPGAGSYQTEGDRFFWAPFLVGGLAGTALGYGLGSNNNYNHPTGYYYVPPVYSQPSSPYYYYGGGYYY